MISTRNVDRYGDTVAPEGARLDAFRANPVLLFGHDTTSLPIGSVVDLVVEPDGLRASWVWLKNDEDAMKVKNAWDQGALRAASIGFLPITWVPNATNGHDILDWELVEVSLVPVPANRESVRLLKSLTSRGATLRGVDPAAFAGRLADNVVAILAAQRQQLALREAGILLLDDGRSSVTASEIAGTIRSAFARRR